MVANLTVQLSRLCKDVCGGIWKRGQEKITRPAFEAGVQASTARVICLPSSHQQN